MEGTCLWRCLSPPHSSCEGYPHSQARMFGATSRQGLMVPKDRDTTTSLGHVLLPHSSGAEWFHLSLQRSLCCRSSCWLLSFHQAPLRRFGSTFSVYLSGSGRCICGPSSHLSSGLKKPSSLGLSLYATCSTLSPNRWLLLGFTLSSFLSYQGLRLDTVLHIRPRWCLAVGNTALAMI